ncbi:hypothetical protein [Ralstonia pickettii]|nr:hypothetical protein [Ralstonia pickettii]
MKRVTPFIFSMRVAEIDDRSEMRLPLRNCTYQKLQIPQQILSHVI